MIYSFIFVRLFENALIFLVSFISYKYLSVEYANQIFRILILTTFFTFIYSLGSNYRIKYQNEREYYRFQFIILILSLITVFFYKYSIYISVLIYLKSIYISKMRIHGENISLSVISAFYPLFSLIYIALIIYYDLVFNDFIFISCQLMALSLFTLKKNNRIEILIMSRNIFKKYNFDKIKKMTRYFPLLFINFYVMSYDKIYVSSFYDDFVINNYSKIDILAQIPVMLMLMILFYINPKIFRNYKIKKKFINYTHNHFYILITLLFISLLYTKLILIGNNYVLLINDTSYFFNLIVVFNKLIVFYMSIFIIQLQIINKENKYGKIILYLLTILIFLFLLLFFKFDITIQYFLLINCGFIMVVILKIHNKEMSSLLK